MNRESKARLDLQPRPMEEGERTAVVLGMAPCPQPWTDNRPRRRRRRPMSLAGVLSAAAAAVLACVPVSVEASNWAQATGPQQQNNIVPRIPNPDILMPQPGVYPGKNDHWSRRQGQALVITPANDSTLWGKAAHAFILGGDSFVRDSSYTELSGQYMNDVWHTTGVTWRTVWDTHRKVGGRPAFAAAPPPPAAQQLSLDLN